MSETPYVYELTFHVPASEQDAYDEWLASTVIDWAGHDAVGEFDFLRGTDTDPPGRKLVFGFHTRRAFEAFTETQEHRTAVERLEDLTERLDQRLWDRNAVRLNVAPTESTGPDRDENGDGDAAAWYQ